MGAVASGHHTSRCVATSSSCPSSSSSSSMSSHPPRPLSQPPVTTVVISSRAWLMLIQSAFTASESEISSSLSEDIWVMRSVWMDGIYLNDSGSVLQSKNCGHMRPTVPTITPAPTGGISTSRIITMEVSSCTANSGYFQLGGYIKCGGIKI